MAVVLAAVIWAAPLTVSDVLVEDWVVVCSLAAVSVVAVVVSAAVLSVFDVVDVVVVELLDVRRDPAAGRFDEPDAVDDAVVFLAAGDDVLLVLSAADDEVGALGPRAVWPVAFFADPELDVAEFAESEAELWSVSSALATATMGLASDNPSARAAIPALAPR
ncbi:hypothetical protein FHT40_001362 [Mycolicibacterium sp. BK556]|uniref:hypothetical protein n=1 Tax=unclassified Mycolicibacterium TaxID=2636767 RepID=UPI001606FB4C|nr:MULTISPECIES: hypothetical protein [unclassified Mycolicibacterium]MBB3601729.1 hypothetical protein [Mycolicibacterium sp. BK556]MBB3631481.1 hypothetical protein [Mycolicibacterium sp. BK607]